MKAPTLDLSLLLATRNRAALLEATLGHVAGLDTNGISWELIVVDNGSTDATPAVLERARSRLPLTALHEARPGKNRAINRGLEAARGRLLVFTDDDVEPVTCWLTGYLAAARRWPEYSIFGGPVVPRFPPETPQWLREHERLADCAFAAWGPAHGEGPCVEIPFGPNFAIDARCFSTMQFSEAMGSRGADTDLMGGEVEFLRRLRDAGERVIFVPSVPVGHVITPGQLERGWLLRRMFRIGRTMVRLTPDTGSTRLCGAPRFLWRLLISSWLRRATLTLASDRARLDAGLEFYQLRGMIYEYLAAGQTAMLPRILHP